MPIAYLEDRGVVRLAGEDARALLQRLITCDLDKVTPKQPRFGALLSPQGKIACDFIVVEAPEEDGGAFFLDCPRALASDLTRKLTMFRLRARVTIEDLSATLGIAAIWSDAPTLDEAEAMIYPDPRLVDLGQRAIGEHETLRQHANAGAEAYHAHRIAEGVPEGGKDFIYTDAFPHETLMDQLSGVDFAKGCYVGQEVVSRMQHRGSARTRIVPAIYRDGTAPLEGVDVKVDDRVIGVTGSQHHGRGLIKIRLDKFADARNAGQSVTAGGIELSLAKRPWMHFAVADEAPSDPLAGEA